MGFSKTKAKSKSDLNEPVDPMDFRFDYSYSNCVTSIDNYNNSGKQHTYRALAACHSTDSIDGHHLAS